jgi:hypothetical protein
MKSASLHKLSYDSTVDDKKKLSDGRLYRFDISHFVAVIHTTVHLGVGV